MKLALLAEYNRSVRSIRGWTLAHLIQALCNGTGRASSFSKLQALNHKTFSEISQKTRSRKNRIHNIMFLLMNNSHK